MNKPRIISDWMSGAISTGKMLESFEIPRPTGDDLAGLISNCYNERIGQLVKHIEHKREIADKFYREALSSGNDTDATAEASKNNCLMDIRSQIRILFDQ